MALARLVTISESQEQGDGSDRVDDHDQGDELLTRKKVSTGTRMQLPQNVLSSGTALRVDHRTCIVTPGFVSC
jgi:hypothetical protein